MFTTTLEESQTLQARYQEQAQSWRLQHQFQPERDLRSAFLLALAKLMISSGTQLKNKLQPA